MQKRVNGLLILLLGIFVFAGFVAATTNYAVLQSTGNYCDIEPASSCTLANNNGTIVMGLSASTNAHGQLASQLSYNYVLCCHFAGSTTCNPTTSNDYYNNNLIPQNKILGLAAPTNAHAEEVNETIFSQTSTANDICYGSIQCINTNACTDAYPINMTSLVSETNSHIGGYPDFPNKICCTNVNTPYLACTLTSATWNPGTVYEGRNPILIINGTNCQTDVSYTIYDSSTGTEYYSGDSPVLTASGDHYSAKFTVPWVSKLGSYKASVTAHLEGVALADPLQSSNTLQVTSQPALCKSISKCESYTTQSSCLADSTTCDIAQIIYDAGKPYNQTHPPPLDYGCAWTATSIQQSDGSSIPANSCFYNSSFSQDNSVPTCYDGTTLCVNQSSGKYECSPWSCSASGLSDPLSSSDGLCNKGNGCGSQNCLNILGETSAQDSCLAGHYCQGTVDNAFCKAPPGQPSVYTSTCSDGYRMCTTTGDGETQSGITFCHLGACPTGSQDMTDGCNVGNPQYCSGWPEATCNPDGSCRDPSVYSGNCIITTGTSGSCADGGFITLKLTATWKGDQSQIPPSCKSGARTVECPAQIQLSFFDTWWNWAITLAAVVLIYAAAILLRKKRKAVKKSSKKKIARKRTKKKK